jgi:hypothetical protein
VDAVTIAINFQCLEVWNNLTHANRSSYPIECRRVLEQMQPKPEWWEIAIRYLVALFVISVLFWCLEAFLYAVVERNVWIPVLHYRGDEIPVNRRISAALSVFIPILISIFGFILYFIFEECYGYESRRSTTLRVTESKAVYQKRLLELEQH